MFPLNFRIVLSDPFSDVSYLCVSYVYNDCHRTNQNHRSKMGRTSHLSSNDSDSSDDSHYRRKRRKDKKHREKDPIRLCATLTTTLLTTAYKSKIIRFKMDEDPLKRWIYFLTFIDSLDMIFHSTEKLVKFFYVIQK